MPFEKLAFSPRFDYGDQATVAPAVDSDDGTSLGSGFVRLTNASIPWTVQYDEVLLVIDGCVTVHTNNHTLTARKNDTIWLPKGTELRYEAESALIFYAIEPNDWSELS